MKKSALGSFALLLGLLGSACTDDAKKIEEPVQAEAAKKDASNEFTVDAKTGKLEFKAEIVYFGYDETTLTKEGMARLDAIAEHMKSHEGLTLKIEGHCDDRGSTEYNLALGQRRSDSVRRYLETIGIGKDRLASVSFGEERPAESGQGEQFWAKNRRAEFAFNR